MFDDDEFGFDGGREFLSPNKIVIEVEWFLNKVFNTIIELFWQDLGPTLVKSPEPNIEILNPNINNILQFLLRDNNTVNGTHKKWE